MKAPHRTAVSGALAGNLRATSVAAILIQLLDARKAGTLRIAGQHGEVYAQVLFRLGLPVSARVRNVGGGALAQALVPLCARGEGEYVFLEGSDEVGEGPDVLVGRVDPLALIVAAVRGPFREDAIDDVLLDHTGRLLKLNPSADLTRYEFTQQEKRLVDLLQQPMDFGEWKAKAQVPERTVRCLAYALLVTRGVVSLPGRRTVSGTVSAARSVPPPLPAALRYDRDDEPTNPRLVGISPPFQPAVPEGRSASGVIERVQASATPPPAVPSKPRPTAKYFVKAPVESRTELPPSVLDMGAPGELPPALDLWRKEILVRHRALSQQSPFEVLGVSETPDDDELLQAYITLSNRFQPEGLPDELRSLKARARAICDRLSEAYETLRDPLKRLQARQKLADTTPRLPPREAYADEADGHYQEAQSLLRRKEYVAALREAHFALTLNGSCAEYEALYAWLLYLCGGASRVHPQAWEHLDRALKYDPACERAHYYKAVLLKHTGQADQAHWHFKRALRYDPKNLEAQREIRLYETRRKERESGLLNKIFSRFPPKGE